LPGGVFEHSAEAYITFDLLYPPEVLPLPQPRLLRLPAPFSRLLRLAPACSGLLPPAPALLLFLAHILALGTMLSPRSPRPPHPTLQLPAGTMGSLPACCAGDAHDDNGQRSRACLTDPEEADVFFVPFLASLCFNRFSVEGMHSALTENEQAPAGGARAGRSWLASPMSSMPPALRTFKKQAERIEH